MNPECSITLRAIVHHVARARGVPERHIYGRRQDRKSSDARNIVYWLARELPGLSCTVIGNLLGDRDASTISQQCVTVEQARAADPAFAVELDNLMASLNGSARSRVNGMLAEPDPAAVAARIARAVDPIREGLRVSALEIAALGIRAADLEDVAAATFQMLARCDHALTLKGAAAREYAASTRALVDAIASALGALGYATTEDDEETTNQQETLNDASRHTDQAAG